jgi:hypothetical protein
MKTRKIQTLKPAAQEQDWLPPMRILTNLKKTQLKKEAALAASTSEQRESCSKNTTARARNRSTEENIDRCLAKRQKTKLEKRPHRI